MSSIEFDELPTNYRKIDISGAVTHNTPLLIKYGVVKDLAIANKIMLLSVTILIISSVFILTFGRSGDKTVYKEDFTSSELNRMLPEMVNNLPHKPQ